MVPQKYFLLWGHLAKHFPDQMLGFCRDIAGQDNEMFLTYLALVVNCWDGSSLTNKEELIARVVNVCASTDLAEVSKRDISSPLCVAAYLNGDLGARLKSDQLASWLWEALDEARFFLEQKMKALQCEEQNLLSSLGSLPNVDVQHIQNYGQSLFLIAQRLPASDVEAITSRFQSEKAELVHPIAVSDVCQSLRSMLSMSMGLSHPSE